MSVARVFSLLGDSNVRNNVNKTSTSARASIKSAQVISCGHLENLVESLSQVRESSNVCILACVTNFLASCDGPSSVSQRIQSTLQDIRDAVAESCLANPSREYLISPPMYRTSPIWYREGLPEILTIFSQTLGQRHELPPNLRILPSFATPEYDDGGIHLTAYSGLEFLLHLFDSASDLLEKSPELSEVTTRTCESTRVLEDRVMVLEQDHKRLNRVVEHKIAIDSELSDARLNEQSEDSFIIAGLPLIPDDITGKEWQKRALTDVRAAIKILMGRDLPVLFVQNSTKRYKDAEVTYTVKMIEVSDSKAIRRKFGSFYLGGKDGRPENLEHLSIKNKVTPETLTRISILKLLAKRYRTSNPGARVKVIGYDPRPMIKIVPAQSASDRRVKNFNFVQAVTKLPTNFSAEEVEPILRRINPELCGKIRSLFIVLSDDAFRKILRARKSEATGPRPSAPPTPTPSSNTSEVDPTEGSEPTPGTRKRGASSPADGSAAKK